jgi:hypothetical protein
MKNVIGAASGMYGAGERCIRTEFWWRNLMERDDLESLGVDARIMLKWDFKKRDGGGRGRGLD